jgi:hypothetical protein
MDAEVGKWRRGGTCLMCEGKDELQGGGAGGEGGDLRGRWPECNKIMVGGRRGCGWLLGGSWDIP